MPHVLGEKAGERPHPGTGCDSWRKLKGLLFDVLGYDVRTPDVFDFHASEARINVITARARGGKSWAGAYDAAPYVFPTEHGADSMIWTIGPTYQTNKEFDYLHDIFVNQRERLWAMGWRYEIERERNAPKSGDMEVRLIKNPGERPIQRAYIRGYSATNEETLQGEEVTVAVMSEAAEHPPHIYSKYLEQRCMRIIMPTTPKQKGAWLKDLIEGADAEHGIAVFEFQHYEVKRPDGTLFRYCPNPNYQWDRFDQAQAAAEQRAKARMGPEATAEDDPAFAEQFLGRWTFYEGRVLPFERARHMVRFRDFDYSTSTTAISVDYGYEDPFSVGFWAIHPSGIYVRLDELYERRIDSKEMIRKVRAKCEELGIAPAYCTGDPSRPEVSRLFSDHGFPVNVRDKNAQRARDAGTRRVVDLLMQGPVSGFPGLLVTDRCHHSAQEFERLHYKKRPDGHRDEYSTTAFVGEDHAFDDTRYFVMTRPSARIPEPAQSSWLEEAMAQTKPRASKRFWPEGAPSWL